MSLPFSFTHERLEHRGAMVLLDFQTELNDGRPKSRLRLDLSDHNPERAEAAIREWLQKIGPSVTDTEQVLATLQLSQLALVADELVFSLYRDSLDAVAYSYENHDRIYVHGKP